jgi:hypothetical protein
MEAIIATRYAPLVLPQLLNALPPDGYLKQLPKFTGEGDIAVESRWISVATHLFRLAQNSFLAILAIYYF